MATLTAQQRQDRFDADMDLLHQFVTGPNGGTVEHETGTIPNLATLASRSNTQFLQLGCSDMGTALIAGVGVAYARAVNAGTFNTVRASLFQASSAGAVEIDIKVNGVSVLSTLLSIDQGESTSVSAAVPAVIANGSVADDDVVSIDIVTPGNGAKGLIVTLLTF